MKIITRKILIIFLVVAILLNTLILPKKAEAIDIVWDPGNWIANLGSWIWDKLTKTVLDTNWWESKLNDTLRDVVAKKIMDYIVDETIKWVSGGGKPKFVTDWQGFLRNAGNIAFGQVLKDVGLAWLCQPFSLQVRISLLPVPKFSQRIECTLDDVVKNIEDFYKDFQNGGWIAYQEAWYPQGNYYGEMLMIHDEMLMRGALAKEAAQNEALAGKGFLSVKKCVLYDDYGTGECLKYEITTPGDTVGEAVANAITSDTQWAANIKSWTSALVNALINRLITQGISSLKGSAESYDYYYPTEYTDLVEREIEQQKQKQIAQIKEFIDEWQYLSDTKSKAVSYAEQLDTILTEIKNRNCPAVSEDGTLYPEINSQIQTNKADIDRLKTEINNLKTKIDEGNDLISEINSANTTEERAIASHDFTNFMDRYNTSEMQEQIITGSARDAADKELATKTSDLSTAQERLNTCIAEQSSMSTSTPPNQP